MEKIDSYPLTAIRPSPFNPRKRFPEAELQELADSIQAVGVMQPILIRPIPKGAQTDIEHAYEIVFGERRFRASMLAGFDFIPAMLRELDDRQAAVMQTHENAKRRDITAFEEAASYHRLMVEHNMSAAEVITEVGVSKAQFYGLMKLHSNAGDAVRDAFDNKGLPAELAIDICRRPSHKAQEAGLKKIRAGDGWLSTREAKTKLREGYVIDLSLAPFPLDDTTLNNTRTPCTTCGKRAGNAPDMASEKPNTCFDTECYAGKVDWHRDRKLDALRAEGHVVMTDAAARAFSATKFVTPSGYAKLEDRYTYEGVYHTVLALLGEAPETYSPPQLHFVVDEPGATPRGFIKREYLDKLLDALEIGKPSDTDTDTDDDATSAGAGTQRPIQAEPDPMADWSEDERLAADDTVLKEARRALLLRLLETPRTVEDLRAVVLHEMEAADGLGFVGQVIASAHPDAYDDETLIDRANATELGALIVGVAIDEQLIRRIDLKIYNAKHSIREKLALLERYGINIRDYAPQADAAEPASTPSPAAPAVEGGAQTKKVVARYRNAATGETWSGKGLMPKWLKVATAAGAKLTDFEVKVESKAASGGKAKTKPASPAAAATNCDLFAGEGAAS
jgi:ParB/RepB/Spo0J family partition protein